MPKAIRNTLPRALKDLAVDAEIKTESSILKTFLKQTSLKKTSLSKTSLSRRLHAMVLVALFAFLGTQLAACVPVAVVGGAAAVAAGSTEKGLGTSISDGIIKTKISDKFFRHDNALFFNVTITVNDGKVLLTGDVENPEHKILATKMAWDTFGVTEVINEVQITDESSLKNIAQDRAAAAQLRTKLIAEPGVSSLNFSIDVVNGTIFLAGIARSEKEMNTVVRLAREVGFAKKVVNYIRVSDDNRN